MLLNRRGCIRLPKMIIEMNPEQVVDVLKQLGLIPTSTIYNELRKDYEITGISHMFEEIDEGDKIPCYLLESRDNDDGLEVRVIKQNCM